MSDKRRIILEALADGRFHSGQKLGEQLGISRAAVGKHVEALRAMGLDIFSVTGKGYQCPDLIQLIEPAALKRQLDARGVVAEVDVHLSLPSTNDYLMERRTSLRHGATVVAEHQSAGRGRRGRTWQSPLSANLYFSSLFRFNCGIAGVMGLSQAVAVGLANTLNQFGVEQVAVKWPNDLYVEGKKVGGILIELDGQMGDLFDAIIGVGLNWHISEAVAKQIDQPWTALAHYLPASVGREQLAAEVICALHRTLSIFEAHGLQPFLTDWQRYDYLSDKAVVVTTAKRREYGRYRGMAEDGALLVETERELKRFYGGEVSVRESHESLA